MEQEYLTTGGTPGLDGGYTVFGEVIEGLDVVENIQSTATDSHDRPQTDIVILHAVVEQKSKKAVFARIILKTSDFIGVFFSLHPPAHDEK